MTQNHGPRKTKTAADLSPVANYGPKGIPVSHSKATPARSEVPEPPYVVTIEGRYLPVSAYRPDLNDILVEGDA